MSVTTRHPYFPFTAAQRNVREKARWHVTELIDRGPSEAVATAIQEFGADLVLTQNLTGLGLRFAQDLRRRLGSHFLMIHTLRDYGLICVRNTCYHRGQAFCPKFSLCSLKRAMARMYFDGVFDGVVGLTSVVQEKHNAAGLFRATPSRTIHNTAPVSDMESKYPPATNGFGYLGSLTEEKGVLDLLQAYSIAYQQDQSIGPLLLAGQGTAGFESILRERSSGLPVELLGRVERTTLFRRVATLVVPSRWDEPFGRVVIEGASAGLRLILSDRGGLEEAASSLNNLASGPSIGRFEGGNVPALASCLLSARELIPFKRDVHSEPVSEIGQRYINFAENLVDLRS